MHEQSCALNGIWEGDLHVFYWRRQLRHLRGAWKHSQIQIYIYKSEHKSNITESNVVKQQIHCFLYTLCLLYLSFILIFILFYFFAFYYWLNFDSMCSCVCYLSQWKFVCNHRSILEIIFTILFDKTVSGVKQAKVGSQYFFTVVAMVSVNSFTEIEDIVQQNQQSLCEFDFLVIFFFAIRNLISFFSLFHCLQQKKTK